MNWVVDTCVVLDVFEHDPQFGTASAGLLQRLWSQGLSVCPVTMVELGAVFAGDFVEQKRFLDLAGISYHDGWNSADTERAQAAWDLYVRAKRAGQVPKRPVADVLIGAFAANRRGLITRNPADFRRWFPKIVVREP